MSRHRASRTDPATAWRPGAERSRPAPLAGLLTGFGVLVLTVAVLAYLISAQPGKAPGSRLVEPVRSTAGRSESAGQQPGSGSTRPLPAPVLDRAARPVRLRLPSIGVDSALQPLGLLPDGSLQPPSDRQQAGWYAGGTVPGNVGPAVITGDEGSAAGPAVFSRLSELRPGDPVLIIRQDGGVLRFAVDEVQAYGSRGFPSRIGYGPVATPQLRLITDDLVVQAQLR